MSEEILVEGKKITKLSDMFFLYCEKKKEIECLQKEKEDLKKYHNGFVANCRYCDEWYMDKCNYIKKDNKYKQLLEKIREIAENSYSAPCLEHGCDCEHCEDECTDNGKHCMEYGLKKIQKKINEVLND